MQNNKNTNSLLLLDPIGVVTQINKYNTTHEQLFPDNIIGQSFSRFYSPFELSENIPSKQLDEAIANGTSFYRGIFTDNTNINYSRSINLHSLFDNTGSVSGFILMISDYEIQTANRSTIVYPNIFQQLPNNLKVFLEKFNSLIDYSYDGVSMLDEKGIVIYQSPAIEQILGYKAEETIWKKGVIFFHPDEQSDLAIRMQKILSKPSKPYFRTNRMLHKNGHYIWVEGTTVNLLNDDNINAIVGNFRDITERKNAEKKIEISNRLYSFISQINKTILNYSDAASIFKNACEIAIKIGKFEIAWFGYVNKEREEINCIESYGVPDDIVDKLNNLKYQHNGPIETAMRTGVPYICNDIENDFHVPFWQNYAINYGLGSCAFLPMFENKEILGMFNLYATEKNFFDTQEVELITEISRDISYALAALHTKRQSEMLHNSILHSKQRLKQAQKIAQLGTWEYDFSEQIMICSEEYCKMYHIPFKENKLTVEQWFALVHPEDLSYVRQIVKEAEYNMKNVIFNYRAALPNGAIKYMHCQTNFEYDENHNPIALFGIAQDITEQKLAEEKIIHANHLFAFISQINKTIVHAKNADTVYEDTCRIAIEIGKFSMAWIGLFDETKTTIDYKFGQGIPENHMHLFQKTKFDDKGAQYYILNNNSSYVCNDVANEILMPAWRAFAAQQKLNSCMILPIRLGNEIIGSFNLYARDTNFFDEQEVQLLEEIANDISFAIEGYNNEKIRRQIEDELKHKKIRLQQAQAIAHLGSWEYDFKTREVICSEEYCNILNISEIEKRQTADSILAFTHPDDRIEMNLLTEQAQNFKNDFSINYRIITRSGTVKHIHSQTTFEKENNGNVIGVHGIALDITEQVHAEEKIKNANRLYAFISEINQTIVQIGDEKKLFNAVCSIAIEIGQFELAWVSIPDPFSKKLNLKAHYNATNSDLYMLNNLVYEDDGPLSHVLNSNTTYVINDFENDEKGIKFKAYAAVRGLKSCIILPILKNGKTIGVYVLISKKLNFFDEEEIRLLEEATKDISFALGLFEKEKHRKEMEQEILHSEMLMKQAQAIGHFGSWEINLETDIAELSEEACRILGLNTTEHVQTLNSWLSFIHPDDRDFVQKMMNKDQTSYDAKAFNYRIIRIDGVERHIDTHSAFVMNKHNKPVKLYGVVHDITEQKNAEAEKTKMVADIVQRNKDLEQFSYIVSHNLRTPVANITGLTQILQMPDMDNNRKSGFVTELSNSVKKLDDVIMDLNYILQVKQNGVKKLESVAFSTILCDIEQSIENTLKSNFVTIDSDFSEVDEMFTFKSYLYSIFLNIITNSIKYQRPNVPPVISIVSTLQKNKIQIKFTDNGLGIDLTKKGNQIFGLYKRFHDHVEGKGMGLFMVKTQVESLGGTISVSSELNKGTQFCIEFALNKG